MTSHNQILKASNYASTCQDGDTKVYEREKYEGKMDLDKILGCKMKALPISNLLKSSQINIKFTQ